MKKNTASALGILITMGIVFGDIGTSPLYVWKAIIGDQIITEQLVFGAASLIFWTLTIQTTIKYIVMTLRADNDGQGGIFALYALIRPHNISRTLLYATIAGAACILADGFIAPAISISSAVEGISNLPTFAHFNTTIVTAVIISCLFLFQQRGTMKVGKVFGPVMVVWFSMLAILGIFAISKYPDIIAALSPHYGLSLLIHQPELTFMIAGGIFLCTTGAEGLYSDLGHCGRTNIRLAWIGVKSALVINYFGQAAWLLTHQGKTLDGLNPFYEVMPTWWLPLGITIATFATIIASQAVISAAYTLVSEGIKLNLLPKWKIVYPSDEQGQLFVPMINLILWIGCMLVLFSFKTSTEMEGAYGLAIINTMILTTFLLLHYMKYKGYKSWFIWCWGIFYLSGEGFFLVANSKKFLEGGWATLLIAGVFGIMMIAWYLTEKLKRSIISQKVVSLDVFSKKVSRLHENIPFVDVLVLLSKTNAGKIDARLMRQVQRGKKAKLYIIIHIDAAPTPFENDWQIVRHENVVLINVKRGFRMKANLGSELRIFLDKQKIVLPKMVNQVFPVFKFLAVDNHVIHDAWFVRVANFIKPSSLNTLDHFFPDVSGKENVKMLISEETR